MSRRHGAWDSTSTYIDCLRVDVLAEAGPSAALRAGLERIIPWGHEFACHGLADHVGSIHYFVGCGLHGLRDLPAARAAYQQAIDANRTAGVLQWQRRAEARLAAPSAPDPAPGNN
ncbi:hypothetical protein AB0M54_18490 [Actinoplanes sp. NPDC051470]